MGKHGPCRHCGVTNTPLWRNGPPEKPVLCNACGSRWRTKGSLANYTPLHAREQLAWEEPKLDKVKIIHKKPKMEKLQKRKQISDMVESKHEILLSETLEENASSGPTISYSESCAHLGNSDASDRTGSAQSNAWDSLVPSKKRTIIRSKHSSVEKLTKDLYSIWHEQQSSNLSETSEDDLLFEDDNPMGSVEIGHGGVLLRYPWSKAVEEESEASSFPPYDKLVCDAHSRPPSFPINIEIKRTGFSNASVNKLKISTAHSAQENSRWDRISPDILNMLQGSDSLLWSANLEEKTQKQVTGEKIGEITKDFYQHSNLTASKRPCESENQHLLESKEINSSSPFKKSWFLNSREAEDPVTYDALDITVDNDGTCFSPRSLFTSPPDRSSVMQLTDESSDQELLSNLRCSTATFPEAVLLYNHNWSQKAVSNGSPADSGVANEEEILSNFPAETAASFSRQQLK